MIISAAWFSGETVTLRTGTNFDALQLAQHHGEAVINRLLSFDLDSRIGLISAKHDQWYILLPPGSSEEPWPAIAQHLGKGSTVTLPPPHSTDSDPIGLRWIRAPRDVSTWFSDPPTLRTPLEVVAANRTTIQT
ncbi:hypothetical protein STBA_39720 [Streptomyces sp. MP131-18]|nr:hypothetical protein STBA_39720 [Streptomyces sp. MP131-18]